MVFESALSEVLNRFIGDYVENLDRNQLKVGIWGGDVELTNLILKQSALDDLDLPLQTVYGRIGKLVLKIPWKNLYGSAFIINIEDIYLLAAPNQQVKYDPEKEEKKNFEVKLKEIQKVEAAKKLEAEKDKPKADYTFVEKLVTQIIKNVQLNIKNIHIRYEDKVTNPNLPFALGITLSDLNVVSTDETWTPAITQENISKIFKIVKLEGLAVYWNPNAPSYATLPGVDLMHRLTTEIATKTDKPSNYAYILGPINASVRLRINQKPELDVPAYSIPKVHLNLDLEKLFVGVTRAQYQGIIALGDSMDRMVKGMPYRKYRPDVEGYKNHYKEWWHFAYKCVLEEHVRRRRRNWQWENILGHRNLCKEYGTLYKKKLNKELKKEETPSLEKCEKCLDVMNIVIIRQRIELETERLEKVQQKAEKKGWFGWMWGSNPSQEQEDISKTTNILRQFEKEMTPEEKARMYKALDYQENAAPAQYPEAFVDNSCTFLLRTLEVELRDDDDLVRPALFTELKGVKCRLDTRAAASAVKVHIKIDEFATYGLQQDDFIPGIITSEIGGGDSGLLEVAFETNPLDKSCGQRLHVTARPLKIVYDAQTINKVVDIFAVPPSTSLDQLSAAAGSSFNNVKEMSTTGLQHAIETHTVLDLKIDLQAPYIIIPYGGKYTDNENVLVLNLGNFKMYSTTRGDPINVRKMHAAGMENELILKEMIAQSYDRFTLEMANLQVMVAQSSEDWKSYVHQSTKTPMHLLEPVNLNIDFFKCLITDDPRLPLTKITGELPSINVTLSDARLLLLVALAASIPLPGGENASELKPLSKVPEKGSSMVMLKYLEMQDTAKKTRKLLTKLEKKDDFVQFTTVDLKFVMSELKISIQHQDTVESPLNDLTSFHVKSLECGIIQQTFNTKVDLRLGGIELFCHAENETVALISSPKLETDGQYLFQVKLTQVNKNSPEFYTVYKSCETALVLHFAKLDIVFHQESLLALMEFASQVQAEINETMSVKDRMASVDSEKISLKSIRSNLSQFSEGGGRQSKSSRRTPVVETIKFKLVAKLEEVSFKFTGKEAQIAHWAIRGIQTELVLTNAYTQVGAKLEDLVITDLNPDTIYKTIVKCTSSQALDACVVIYNSVESNSDKPDIKVEVTFGGLRVVFLNWFVVRILNFLNQFQAAENKIIEASHAAAQTARQNMTEAYEKSTKILLNINLKAPDVIVPVDSHSHSAVLIDLGNISVSNRFLILDIKSEQGGHCPIIDELRLGLREMKILKVRFNEELGVVGVSQWLEPLTFKFAIKRNLSVSWYKAVPDIDIEGKIDQIMLLLSQSDYRMMLEILAKNLTEGQVPRPKDLRSSLEKQASEVQTVVQLEKMVIEEETQSLGYAEVDPKVHTFLRFNFKMEKLGISLFMGDRDSGQEEKSDENLGLARFTLEGLSVKGRMQTDNIIITSVLLLNCVLEDRRKGRQGKLTRLIERSRDVGDTDSSRKSSLASSTDSLPVKSMVDVTLHMKDNYIFSDVRVYSFTIILSVDYLLQLAEFFKPEDEEVKLDPNDHTTQTIDRVARRAPSSINTKQSTSLEKAGNTQMTLNLKLEKPDIILVEHMDNIDTKAMILNSEIMIKARIMGNHQVINGTVKDLQLYTCAYNPQRRAETRSNVLHPVTISLAGSTPEGKGLHVELLVTDILLRVSPNTIELLNRVMVTATGRNVARDSGEIVLKDHTDIWEQKSYTANDFWFLRADESIEATEGLDLSGSALDKSKSTSFRSQELCIVQMPSVILTIEAGVGNKTLPMLIMESNFKGNVRNWSSQMSVDATLTLQMGYYNSRLAVWEPLIEPVEVLKDNRTAFVPWELRLEVSMNEQEDLMSPVSEVEVSSDAASTQQPVMDIDITSDSNLELTVTKTCLEVLNNLGKAFANAMKTEEIRPVETLSPYKVVNMLGASVIISLDRGSFSIHQGAAGQLTEVVLETGAEVPLKLRSALAKEEQARLGKNIISETATVKDYYLNVKVVDKNCNLDLPVVRADKRYFPLNFRGEGNDPWGLISDVIVDEGVTVITLRSVLQVHNHFNVPVEVYYMTARGNELASIAVIEPNTVLNIPLHAVYTPTNELFFSINGYSVTTTPYVWKDLQTNLTVTKTLHCNPKNLEQGTEEPFIIKAVGEMEQVYFENTSRYTMSSTCYNIHLRPSITFKNRLPIDVICCVENVSGETTVKPGDTLILPSVEPGRSCLIVRLPEYLEKEWSSRQEVTVNFNEFSVWTFFSFDSPVKMALDLGMHQIDDKGSTIMTLYCPFWMLNKTGLMIAYRKSKRTEKHQAAGSPAKSSDENLNVLHHPPNFKGPILFSFNPKNFFGKKKASVRVENGEWSDKFSLDVAGSSGMVTCKSNNMIYQIGVQNQLTYNSLTKQITFTPYNCIINNTNFAIECQENDRPADPWVRIEPQSCSALWPKSELDDKLLRLRVCGTEEISAPFLYTESHTSLLKLKNQYGGVNVDIQISEGAVYINFAPYDTGMAPALIINNTRHAMNFWEKDTIQIKKLKSNHYTLFTWDNPSGARVLAWEVGQKKEMYDDLRKDGMGEYSVAENYQIFWVSFLDGMQRILIFTENQAVALNAQSAKLFEVIEQEITVSIHGVGLSLVNNFTRQEVMYMGIASSGVIWEQCKMSSKRFKQLNAKDSMAMEKAYQRYLAMLTGMNEEDQERFIVDAKTEVDFKLGIMMKPHKRKIRRTFQTGMWIQMKTSPSQLQLHAKINRLQIDNQMFDCIFPVVLAPVPPPKSVAADSGIKPFAELSIVQLLIRNSQIKQFKYFKLLIQEFHIKVDLGFVNSLLDLLQTSEYTDQEEKQQFLADAHLCEEPLYAHVSTQSLQEQKSFYDLLHFSPLKIHLSFSMAAGSSAGQNAATPNFLNVLLQGLGVTLTDLQDVVFKLAYFEREYTFLTQKQLISEVTSHYIGQSVKQLYVLVLGLDVLGNPYGLVLGITKGVEDLFYEPFQGAIQGPGEFAEGLVLGVRSLFGHTVGGAAGAVSRITGAMGKGIAALTFDKDFQRKRRDQINKKPATVQEGIARSGKGLVMGVVDGVTGVFTKPISGAKEEGVGGFFKGLGKGAVGLVARPTAGVVDFASGSLDAVKRATEVGEDTGKLRFPRFIPKDYLVRPYTKTEAEGNKMLIDLEKGKYATTDIYAYHYAIVPKKEILLLTDKRLAYITHNDLFGGWQIDWSYTWQELKQPASVVAKGVCIPNADAKKKRLGLFGGGDSGKIILIDDPAKKEEICGKIESLRGSV